ncbi:YkgJ family cysteine cluster protein [Vibrio vulnificus]|uniref:YkgJ family cysteine cluster protein n=1 Tax=Vibrio parahaemolyticus TaxID=670 RepID=UPI0028233218|nr:YkgJ family cysteine cluster protein [Vibrio parahaemolyticus]EIT6978006.1 YkgJ family cysteine cluster protein [Vibrio vulnificus]EGQ8033694.1 YkgJ family cysteine cluster protein [Vibrio parahaemolyticus]EKA6052523.1 YkgJ family cysteine cluster protein [Vibrio vulnificus]ELB7646237.1 YkgJ family cysteine cluster protein [Vibrio vulnificus]MDX8425289.1 YkgJ family cysteine cluster protein [Vibrio parahaemolyticus]
MKDCNQCGKCCIKYGDGDLAATQEEIDLWELFNPDIFEYVKDGRIWFDPETREQLHRCPFLERATKSRAEEKDKYTCSIYLDRPEDCRHYPCLINEMVQDKCEMIEVTDLEKPKKAQKQLDKLMSLSRPSSHS